ncbi:coiled-coil domain-containing protein 157 isoform X3 [Melopsittacus undulatus]|uniref:coiled-coil domain-containing protein 157 isoform X3 n=1 Tax=Melopsittacus undulatus TaxID=13146 RepID=UPI00146DC396|nr:coiled-coil domain-containing protein 157 isoform X3 [Melopsittacus undulatus]
MAHLLGHQGCMESLRADLRDLQAAIADVSSRAGAVRVPSWKFPDQVSCELDVAALLERYRYSPGEPEVSQHGHVVLLELLIDRLLLLLQTFTGYAEELLNDRAVPPTRALAPGMSAGLTVRKYWCCMLKLGAFYQQLLAEKKASRKENPALPSSPQAGTPEKEPPKHCLPNVLEPRSSQDIAPSTSSLCLPSSVLTPASSASGSSLPRAAHSIPVQPTGTSPGPCATCTSIQSCLHEVGKAITSICQSQNIPSALSRFQEVVGDTTGRRTLSAMDVSYWASEQSKDLSRISKHLQMLLQQVQPLRAELQESEKQKEKLQRQVEDMAWLLQAERDTHVQQQEAQQSLEAKNKEHLEAIGRLELAKDNLQRGAAVLEEQVSTLKEELAGKQAAVQELETAKATLLEEMRTTMVARSQVLALEEKVQLLSSQQESLDQELGTTTTQLQKEKAKVESMERHQESLQAKQRMLLQQLDSLDQEREELHVSLGEAKEDKALLQKQLQESREQHRQQQELLDTLQQEKLGLERAVSELQENVSRLQEQARELQERERLLVFFPELHVPTEAQSESTGSLAEDMKRQLQANSIRIGVLEQENARLSTALGKVKVAAQEGVLKLIPQSQLWSQLSQCSRDTVRQDKGRDSAGTQGPTGAKGHAGTLGCTGDTGKRAPSSQRAKPPWAEPVGKAGCRPLLVAEGLVLSPPEPQGRAHPLSSPHAGGHRQ